MKKEPNERLKEALEKKGISRADLATRTGIRKPTLDSDFNGTRVVTLGRAKKYGRELDCSAHWIMTGVVPSDRDELNRIFDSLPPEMRTIVLGVARNLEQNPGRDTGT